MIRHLSFFTRGALVLATSLSLLAACSSPGPTAPTTVSTEPTLVAPSTSNPQDIPLPTLLPTVLVVVSPLPLTPTPVDASPSVTPVTGTAATAIPVTVTPTPVTVTAVQPTRPPLTNTPDVTATPFPEGLPKVLVTGMRVDPPTPKPDTPGVFYVTFQNVSGENQGYRWKVEIWLAEENKRFGETTPQNSLMPPGETTLTSTNWAPYGQGECRSYRAKAVAQDEEDNRTDFIQANGMPLWLDFSVCP